MKKTVSPARPTAFGNWRHTTLRKKIALVTGFTFTVLAALSQKPNPMMDARNAILADSADKFIRIVENSGINVNDPIKGSPQEWTLLHAACWKVNLKAASYILEKGYKNINNAKNNQNITPLGAIRCQTPEDMMKSMIEAYDIKVKQMEADPELKKKLAPYLTKPSSNISDYGEPAELAKMLIDKGADVNAQDLANTTVMHNAIYAGNVKLVQLLVQSKVNLELRHGPGAAAKQYPTPLHIAIMKDNAEIVKLLIKSGADSKAVLKEYVVESAKMKEYGFNADVYQYLKVKHTPYSLAKQLNRENALKALEELGIRE